MKKIIIVVGVVFGLLLAGVIALPFVVDVDQYRPTLIQFVNSKLNGRFDLGKLKLSLWGELAIEADKALLEDSTQSEILSVGKFKLTVPLKTVLSMKPEIRVVMRQPRISIQKSKGGIWNVSTLSKKEANQKTEGDLKPDDSLSNAKELPAWTKRAALSVAIEEASLKLQDFNSNKSYELNHLNLTTGIWSLQTIPVFKISGLLESLGPFEIRGEAKDSSLKIEANFDKMAFSLGAFGKRAGSSARVNAVIAKKDDQFLIEGNWGPINIHGDYLKQELEVSGDLRASMDKVERAVFKLKAKAFDLATLAKVESFDRPRISINIDSNEMDLDELIDWEKMKQASLAAAEKEKTTETKSQLKPEAESSSVAKATTGDINLQAKFLKAYKVRLEPIKGKFTMKDLKLVGGFEEAKVLAGTMKATAQVDLSSSTPKYAFQAQLAKVSLQEAVASQVEFLRNTMTGSLSGEISGRGESFDAKAAKKNLNASGKIVVGRAKLTTMDINKMVTAGLGGVMATIGDKVPALKGKELKPGQIESEFQRITSSFTIKDGEFSAPDFFAEAIPQKGVDVRGMTKVGLLDYALDADWKVYDTYNVLKADPLLVERGKPFMIPIRVRGTLLDPKPDYTQIPETLARIAMGNLVKNQAQDQLKKITDQAPAPVKNLLKGIFK